MSALDPQKFMLPTEPSTKNNKNCCRKWHKMGVNKSQVIKSKVSLS